MRNLESTVLLHGARKMILQATRLYSWQTDPDLTLQFTNYPGDHFFYELFLVSDCVPKLVSHFAEDSRPFIMTDRIGFTWIAAARKENNTIEEYHLLGPFFTVEASEAYLIRICSNLHISAQLTGQLRKRINEIPTIAMQVVLHYAVMLQYYAANREITLEDVAWHISETAPQQEERWNTSVRHNSWEAEQALFQSIQNGTLSPRSAKSTAAFSGSTIGTLCPWDPLRQTQDEILVLITLACRAAIMGGVPPETSYSIADYYFQRVEACESVGAVQNCALEIQQTFVDRVRKSKDNQKHSAPIRACMDYIQTHILEKIQLEEMAKALGYAPYYLSKRFKSEAGISLNDYIKAQKVERAKAMLTRGNASIAEISEKLAFSSPSYFCTVFKQHTGMMPSEYQNTPTQEA